MTYFPLSDEFHSMPELLGASDAAVALYARAASWSACHLTDGHVPSGALPLLTASHEQAAAELVERRVWRRSRGGFQFVAWPKQATRSNVEAQREASKRRQQKYRSAEGEASRRDSRVSNGVTNGVSHSAHATPRHTTELSNESSPCGPPPEETKPARKRGTRLPEDFAVTDHMRKWATEKFPSVDLDYQTEKFRDHWRASSGPNAAKRDWTAAWRTWIRNAAERSASGPSRTTNGYRPWTNPTDPSAYEGQL